MTLQQASVLIEKLDEKTEELSAQKREEAHAHEKLKMMRTVVVLLSLSLLGFLVIAWIWNLIASD